MTGLDLFVRLEAAGGSREGKRQASFESMLVQRYHRFQSYFDYGQQ